GFAGPALQAAIARHDRPSERREAGAPSPGASCGGGRQWPSEGLFEGLEQQPGLAVAHLHPGRRLADRACRGDQLEQAHLAGAERRAVVEIDANREPGHARTLPKKTGARLSPRARLPSLNDRGYMPDPWMLFQLFWIAFTAPSGIGT